jgi:hypothetical protein
MYKFIMIIAVTLTIFLGGCAPKNYAVAGNKGLPFGTILTVGGQKMIVVSQETQEVKLKPYSSVKKETSSAFMTGVKAEEPKGKIVKPEWESKKVVTEGVKTVQECQDPRGCPQDVTTGECLEGCSEQKVKIEMTETIVTPETKVDEIKPASDTFDSELVLATLFRIDTVYGELYADYRQYYGKPEWLCVLANHIGDKRTKKAISKLIYSNSKFLKICDSTFLHSKNTNLWTAYRP